jgi:hypothetical protein
VHHETKVVQDQAPGGVEILAFAQFASEPLLLFDIEDLVTAHGREVLIEIAQWDRHVHGPVYQFLAHVGLLPRKNVRILAVSALEC